MNETTPTQSTDQTVDQTTTETTTTNPTDTNTSTTGSDTTTIPVETSTTIDTPVRTETIFATTEGEIHVIHEITLGDIATSMLLMMILIFMILERVIRR